MSPALSKKTPVIEYLFREFQAGKYPDGTVYSDDVVNAIHACKANLGTGNPANFLKDIIRKNTANNNWPDIAAKAGFFGRQRYGDKRVFQFVPYAPGQTEPYPDYYLPTASTPRYFLQSATVPAVARELGRKEESWLMQVAVSLRLIESQLSLFSPLRGRLRDVTHLQMSMKTQPEIDGTFLVSHNSRRALRAGMETFALITCEAKGDGERLLEDQIREQVAVAFKTSEHLREPRIDAVKPMAVQVRRVQVNGEETRGIYAVEFQRISRRRYEACYREDPLDPERLYRMPLHAVSDAIYILSPRVAGINA